MLRTLLVAVMGVIEFSGPPAGFAILLAMLLTALFGVDQSRNLLRRFALAAFPA